MRKIFLDANILIDLISGRRKVEGIEDTDFKQLHTSTLSVHILFYVNRIKYNSVEERRTKEVLKHIVLTPLTDTIVRRAYKSKYSDYEDTLQYLMALHANCDYILTRDRKDYENVKKIIPSKIKIVTNISQIK